MNAYSFQTSKQSRPTLVHVESQDQPTLVGLWLWLPLEATLRTTFTRRLDSLSRRSVQLTTNTGSLGWLGWLGWLDVMLLCYCMLLLPPWLCQNSCGKSPCWMDRLTISMAIFNCPLFWRITQMLQHGPRQTQSQTSRHVLVWASDASTNNYSLAAYPSEECSDMLNARKVIRIYGVSWEYGGIIMEI